jgi:uncharacterized iron-regulated membrane protein
MPLIGIDRALAEFRALGVRGSFGLALPIGPKSAYVANYRTDRVEDTRTIYLDPYTGKVLGDIRFRDYHLPGKAIQWATAVHMGQEFGPLNRGVMLAGCLGVVFLAVSSFTMWWKRRPAGAIGIPGLPDDPRLARGLLGIMIPMGLLFPLLGASMLIGLAIEFASAHLARTRVSQAAS